MVQTEYNDLKNEFNTVIYPTKTYKVDFVNNRIREYVTGLEAMEQAIYLILNTERFKYIIYSRNYGIELSEIIGNIYPYVYSVIQQRITEALLQDDRVIEVYNFVFAPDKKKQSLLVCFDVETTEGKLNIEKEVNVYV